MIDPFLIPLIIIGGKYDVFQVSLISPITYHIWEIVCTYFIVCEPHIIIVKQHQQKEMNS